MASLVKSSGINEEEEAFLLSVFTSAVERFQEAQKQAVNLILDLRQQHVSFL